MVYFDNAVIWINGTGIIADSVSIQSQNTLIPIFSVGKKGMMSQEPDGPVSNNIDLSYYLDLNREPLFPTLETIKSITGNYDGLTISIANITGLKCYLTDYKLNAGPNSLVKVDASFVSFEDITGQLNTRPTGVIPISDFSGRLAMGWTTDVVSGDSFVTSPIYDFNYDFSVNWEPTYLLGRKTPSQVDFVGATEKISFLKETYKSINFTGEEAAYNSQSALVNTVGNDSFVNFYPYIKINNSNYTTPTLTINISGHEIHESSISCEVDDFFRNLVRTFRYYN